MRVCARVCLCVCCARARINNLIRSRSRRLAVVCWQCGAQNSLVPVPRPGRGVFAPRRRRHRWLANTSRTRAAEETAAARPRILIRPQPPPRRTNNDDRDGGRCRRRRERVCLRFIIATGVMLRTTTAAVAAGAEACERVTTTVCLRGGRGRGGGAGGSGVFSAILRPRPRRPPRRVETAFALIIANKRERVRARFTRRL